MNFDGSIRIARDNHNSAIWGQPVTVGIGSYDGNPLVGLKVGVFALGLNARGDAVAAWLQFGNSPHLRNMWGSVAPVDTGVWSAPVLLETDQTRHASVPSIVADALGTFYVAWEQGFIQVARYDGQWHARQSIPQAGPPDAGRSAPQLAADRLGNVYATWSDTNVNASIRDAASGTWMTDSRLDICPPTGCARAEGTRGPAIVANGAGDAAVVWENTAPDALSHRVVASYYARAAHLWIPGIELNPQNGGGELAAIDSSGRARVVWVEGSGPKVQLLSRRYRIPGGWGPLEVLREGAVGEMLSLGSLVSTDGGVMLVSWASSAVGVPGKSLALVLAP